MQSGAATVAVYLAELPADRRTEIEPVYELIRDAMPEGYDETIAWGMITWSVPLATFPDTYNGKPMAYVSLAAQKRHNAVYLMGLYSDSAEERDFRRRWTEDGRKLDMGKSCLRFRTTNDLRLDLLAETVAATSPARMIEHHQRAHG